MADLTPEDQKNTPAGTPPASPEKAGFRHAVLAEPEAETGTDPLVAQEEVDRADAARRAEQAAAEHPTETAAPAPVATAALPLSNEAAEEQTRTDHAAEILANAQCLQAIAALFGKDELLLKEYLQDVTLVAQTENGLFLKGADNEFTLSRDIIQAEQETISAKAAFEMSILAFNNPAFEDQGIDLTGNLRDRYMLTLAASHFGLKVTNPVTDIPDDLKAEFAQVKAEWDALVENPLPEIAPAAEAEPVQDAPVTEAPAAEEEEISTPPAAEPVPNETATTAVTETTPAAPPLDEHYNKAVELVVSSGKASKSFLQRSLHVGFNRASRLIEELEKQGVVGPADRAGKREILASPAATPAP